jgi:hypothetical protein
VYFLTRPLKAVAAALRESGVDWRLPVRAARNALYSALPIAKLPAGVSFEPVSLMSIPPELWPRPSADSPISARNPELLQHFANCPVLQRPMYFVLLRNGKPIAYFFLVLAGGQVRLADYGPAGLDSHNAKLIGIAAQLAAKRNYPDVLRFAAATSEPMVQAGLLDAGLRKTFEEEIRGLIADPALIPVRQYRFTYLDLDALCL